MQTLFPSFTYTNPELEELLEDLKTKETLHMELSGRQHGFENQPTDKNHMNIHVINPLTSHIQELLDKNFETHKPASSRATGAALHTQGQDKLNNLKMRRRNIEQERRLAEQEQEKLKRTLKSSLYHDTRITVSVVFGLIETGLSGTLFKTANVPLGFAIIMSLSLGFAVAWGVYLAADYIKKETNEAKRKIKHRIIIAIGLATSIGLGMWRFLLYKEVVGINHEVALEQASKTGSGLLAALPYVLVSFVCFLIALSFELHYWISSEERKKQLAFKAKEQECQKLKAEENKLNIEIDELAVELTNTSSLIFQQQEWAQSYEHRLCGLADLLLRHYESNNLAYRQNNSCPSFFGTKHAWGFRLYFNNIFSSSKTIHS